jgi:hypothetical protein
VLRPLEGSSGVHVILNGLASHHFEQPDPHTVPNASTSTFRVKLAPELATLERATAGLQRAVNAELRNSRTGASSTSSSNVIPNSTRNLRLLVVLWEASRKEQLISSLTSVVGECNPKTKNGDCLICTEPLTRDGMVSVESCGHTTCKDCLRKYICAILGKKMWPISCPICMAERGARTKAQGIALDSYSSEPRSQVFYSNPTPGGRNWPPTCCPEAVDRT